MGTDGINISKLAEYDGIKVEVVDHNIWGVPSNLLAITFDKEKRVLNGLSGYGKYKAVCNCHIPLKLWPHMQENDVTWYEYLEESLKLVRENYDLQKGDVAALLTGVNMEEISCAEEHYDDIWIKTWVTAGCKTNALRIGKDKGCSMERNGKCCKVGTINIIITTNANLSDGAMASSFITATEAKIVALQEYDVRSSYNEEWQATGTGTDQVMIISGEVDKFEYVGGHTKLGEMMAKTITKATKGAIAKQEKRFPNYFDR